MKKHGIQLQSGDFVLTIMTLVLVIFGVIMVFSSSYYSSINEGGTPYSYLIRNIIWAMAGFALMMLLTVVDYRLYKKIALPGIIISIGLLALVLTPMGTEINNASRWIDVGPVTVMPGEITKIAVIIFTAWFLSRKSNVIKSFFTGVLPLIFLAGVCGGLVMMQPNMSTAIIIGGIIFAMMFVAGINLLYFAGMIGAGAAAAAALIISDDTGYRMARVMSFLDPFSDPQGTGYQVVQSLLALGSGGLFGLGLGNSVQKTLYLPEPQNDFILAIIGEELGFIGIILLMACYLVLIWRGIRIAVAAPDRFGMLLASGITIMLGLQIIMNVAVVTSLMPPTGVTLPFVSYGGNALLLFMGSMGILLNISRNESAERQDKK